jgi:hypothetical protein
MFDTSDEKASMNSYLILVYERGLLSLRKIKWCFDFVWLSKSYVRFHAKSRTDIYRDGDRIVIARTGNKLCPVKIFENYLEWSCNPSDSNVYIFRNLTTPFVSLKQSICYTKVTSCSGSTCMQTVLTEWYDVRHKRRKISLFWIFKSFRMVKYAILWYSIWSNSYVRFHTKGGTDIYSMSENSY